MLHALRSAGRRMRPGSRLRLLAALALLGSLAAPATEGLTISSGTGNRLFATARGQFFIDTDLVNNFVDPLPPGVLDAQIDGSRTILDYSIGDAGISLQTQHIWSGLDGYFSGVHGGVSFSLDENVFYDASGFIDSDDFVFLTHEARLDVSLFDFTTSTTVFDAQQTAIGPGVIDEVLGQLEGTDIFLGALSGRLHAGHEYRLDFGIASFNDTVAFGLQGLGSSEFSLALTAVPEPGTALLLNAGLVAMALRRSRGRRRLPRPRPERASRVCT